MQRAGAGPWLWPVISAACLFPAIWFLSLRHSPLSLFHAAQALPRPEPSLPLSGVTLVLDPGHGGADSGAVRYGLCEAALTYRTATELAADVRQAGGRVVFTVHSQELSPMLAKTESPPCLPRDAVLAATGAPLRERDSPRPLWQRAAVACRLWRSHSCSPNLFFLSLHYDDYSDTSIHGALICVDRRMASVPPIARALAATFCAAGLARRDHWHGLRGIAGGRLGVLDPHFNPVPERALLEIATISNADDAQHASDPVWRQAMAARITTALIAVHQARMFQATPAVQ